MKGPTTKPAAQDAAQEIARSMFTHLEQFTTIIARHFAPLAEENESLRRLVADQKLTIEQLKAV